MSFFDPKMFVENQLEEIRAVVGKEKTLIAVSGGVDSVTCAVLTHKSIGKNLHCVMLNDAFMREGEPERVNQLLSQPPLNLPITILNVQERFLEKLNGLRDAEEKRKAFQETFYKVLSEFAENEKCHFLVQGTIMADIIETTGRVKTQHNVLSQVGINPKMQYGFHVVEPLRTIYKMQVREVARYLQIPSEISERQPFPGPGLSVRSVGRIEIDKLNELKKANTITEANLAKHHPDQYFATIIDNTEKPRHPNYKPIRETIASFFNISLENVTVKVFEDMATGVRDGERVYGEIIAVDVQDINGNPIMPPIKSLVELQKRIIAGNPSITRFLYKIREQKLKQPYVISLRAIQTTDFMTAQVGDIPWKTLIESTEAILKACQKVSGVYYDVTPKPPATIEME